MTNQKTLVEKIDVLIDKSNYKATSTKYKFLYEHCSIMLTKLKAAVLNNSLNAAQPETTDISLFLVHRLESRDIAFTHEISQVNSEVEKYFNISD